MSGVDCCQAYVDRLKNASQADKATAQANLDTCNLFKKQPTSELYTTLNNISQPMYSTLAQCLQNRIVKSNEPLIHLINDYEKKKIDAVTASELNKNTMSLYQIDLYYTIGKIFIFFIIILAYYFFLNGQRVFETIQSIIQTVNDKMTKFTEVKAPTAKPATEKPAINPATEKPATNVKPLPT
jgi:hypothetical protein